MRRFLLSGVVAATLSLGACAGGGYYAYSAPPPARVEVRGIAPGPGYTWIDGYYAYRGNSYIWVPGSWVRPPRPRAVWVAPRWEQRNGRYYYHRGQWR
jgi:hypothetical protein